MTNLEVYEKVRAVPGNAQKQIGGGRLKGMTDINPMWRIKVLTEQFGLCGIGWRTVIADKRLEQGANGEIACFVEILLFIKVDGEWSSGIEGIGGSKFVSNETNGAYTSDECFKMAYTDAISVACKALGIGADVYWEADKTKYDPVEKQDPRALKVNEVQNLKAMFHAKATEAQVQITLKSRGVEKVEDLNNEQYEDIMAKLRKAPDKAKEV